MISDHLDWAPVRALERLAVLIFAACVVFVLVAFVATGVHNLFSSINHALTLAVTLPTPHHPA
jgi:hypothetical protein